MKTSSRRHPSAFTLIELLAVITIIAILAGLVVGGMGYVNEKQAREKARVQIALISKALEEYKLDNGTYPQTENTTANTNILFKKLYWDGASDGTGAKKIYLSQFDPENNKQGWTSGTGETVTIIDPWGKPYRYRTALNTAGTPNVDSQNPDFDLWSVGKDGYSDTTKAPDFYDATQKRGNRDDIRNF